jgi:hypothetical protein
MEEPMSFARPRLVTALLVLAMATFGNNAPLALAQADLNETFTLQGKLQQQRAELLREEFKERKQELKEARERAEYAKKHPGKKKKGDKAEPSLFDESIRGGFSKNVLPGLDVAPLNTKANDKTGDGATAGQAEQHIAMLGQNGLAAWNDGQGFNVGPDVQGYGWTVNAGATWTDGGVPLKQGTITVWTSDPSVTVNEKTGDFYYNGLTSNGSTNNGVGVARGHFQAGTFVWDAATVVASGPNSTNAFDKQWIAADSSNGNLYVTWTLFTTTGSNIFFSRSTNNGATWSPAIQINGAWENGLVSGSRPQVGPNGEVYVTYAAIGPVDADSIKVAKSTDGGLTFSPAVVAMTIYDNFFNGAPGFNRPRAVTFPSIAVDRSTGPNRGRVYLAMHDCVNFYFDPLGGGTSKSEVEVNSGFANATPFTIGQTLRGTNTTLSDNDNWSFQATQGTTYLFYADSVKSTGYRYTMRIYCGKDTVAVSRLALSGAQSTTSAQNSHSLIVWTAPETGTYYLRMVAVTVSSTNSNYRIQTAVHSVFGSDVARDTRDIMVTSSANGQTGWTARTRVNDDAPLYDNWLPEIAVPCEGNPYVMWFDYRDFAASCFAGTNIYVSRSTDAGATWAPNQAATTVGTPNWTQVASNIAPNTGDYNGIYGGDCVALAFADGRLGDADVFTARINTEATLSGCPGSGSAVAGTTVNGNVSVNNNNQMFANTFSWTLGGSVNWPSFPQSGTVGASANGGVGSIPFSISIPDTAADGEVVHACLTVTVNGACAEICCFDITVINPATPTLISLFDAANASEGGIALSWSSTATGSIRGWNIYRGSLPNVTLDRVNDALIPMGSGGEFSVRDAAPLSGVNYYRLTAVMNNGSEVDQAITNITAGDVAPKAFRFALAGANPFRGRTDLSLTLPTSVPVRVTLYNVAGQRLRTVFDGQGAAGIHTIPLAIEHAGVYIVKVQAGQDTKSIRVTALP